MLFNISQLQIESILQTSSNTNRISKFGGQIPSACHSSWFLLIHHSSWFCKNQYQLQLQTITTRQAMYM